MDLSTLMFGGTFDPVHNGHLAIARQVAEAVGAGSVLLVPTSANPLKQPPQAPPADRLAMCRQAIAGDPLFEVSDAEVFLDRPSYTIDTVERLSAAGVADDRFGVLIGADMLAELPHWHRATDLLDRVRIVVACRPPNSIEDVRQLALSLADRIGAERAARLADGVVRTMRLEISSTDIRARVAAGRSVRYLVPDPVAEHISRCGLYRAQ